MTALDPNDRYVLLIPKALSDAPDSGMRQRPGLSSANRLLSHDKTRVANDVRCRDLLHDALHEAA